MTSIHCTKIGGQYHNSDTCPIVAAFQWIIIFIIYIINTKNTHTYDDKLIRHRSLV